eukprot:2255662-Pyramimonas_sp.AAC.1
MVRESVSSVILGVGHHPFSTRYGSVITPGMWCAMRLHCYFALVCLRQLGAFPCYPFPSAPLAVTAAQCWRQAGSPPRLPLPSALLKSAGNASSISPP